jgi:hypothetical protein
LKCTAEFKKEYSHSHQNENSRKVYNGNATCCGSFQYSFIDSSPVRSFWNPDVSLSDLTNVMKSGREYYLA